MLVRETLDPISSLIDEEFVFDLTRRVINPRLYSGPQAPAKWLADLKEVWGQLDIEIDDLLDHGDQVVARLQISGRGAGSGAPAAMFVVQLWELREGKVRRLTGGFADVSEALKAVGLRE